MTSAEALACLLGAGIELRLDGEALVAAPRERLNDELRGLVRRHKVELIMILQLRAIEDLREHFDERSGILEYDGGLTRKEAEVEAAKATCLLARDRGYSWDILRAALGPLAGDLPAGIEPVQGLPLGLPRWAVAPAGQAVKQGMYMVSPLQ